METNDLRQGESRGIGDNRVTLRQTNSLPRLSTSQPAGGPLRSPPRTPSTHQPASRSPTTNVPLLKSPLLASSLKPPPRTKRDSQTPKTSPLTSPLTSPGARSPRETLTFTYGTKVRAPPPPVSPTSRTLTKALSSPPPRPSSPPQDTGPSPPPRSRSPLVSMATTTTKTAPTAPQRPSRDRIRSHSPPSAHLEKRATFHAPPAPARPPPTYEFSSKVNSEGRQPQRPSSTYEFSSKVMSEVKRPASPSFGYEVGSKRTSEVRPPQRASSTYELRSKVNSEAKQPVRPPRTYEYSAKAKSRSIEPTSSSRSYDYSEDEYTPRISSDYSLVSEVTELISPYRNDYNSKTNTDDQDVRRIYDFNSNNKYAPIHSSNDTHNNYNVAEASRPSYNYDFGSKTNIEDVEVRRTSPTYQVNSEVKQGSRRSPTYGDNSKGSPEVWRRSSPTYEDFYESTMEGRPLRATLPTSEVNSRVTGEVKEVTRSPPTYEIKTKVVKGACRLFVNPEVPGYVGFANLPNQVHRKSVKKGFEFTLMVVGESGLGKSTLVNSLFLTDLYPERQLADAAEKIEKTVKIDASTVEIEERGVKLRLTVVDTPGFADALNSDNCFKTVIHYIDDQFERYLHDESGLNRRHIVDNRVHCCFYFVNPAGHGLKPLDVAFMKAVHHKVNIVPVIAKADTLTRAEVMRLKKKILSQVEKNGIQIYQLPDCDEDEDEEYKEQCRQLKEAVPFAVVGANQVIEIRGRKVRGRMYPWGVVEVENPEHCDFIKLRTMLVTHMQDLQEVTQEIHYENFRSEKLAVNDGVVRKPKTPRTSRMESEKEAKLSEKEHALQEKENELKRMQEMIARMQAEMKQQQQATQRPKGEAPPPPSTRPPQPANGSVNGHPQQAINNNTKPINTQSA